MTDLGLDQKQLAKAAGVTESYISQVLSRKKAPPAPARTRLYEKIGVVLKLPPGELSKLAELQRKEELKRRVIGPPPPLFPKRRREMLSKCDPSARSEVQKIFEKEPFGELERLVTQTLLKAVHKNAKGMASIRFWTIDLETFSVAVEVGQEAKLFEFVETTPVAVEPGLQQFLSDPLLSSDVSEEEVKFLQTLKFKRKRPSAMYYYRELQSFRDPLHFQT